MRWIIAILLSCGLAGGVYYGYYALNDFTAQKVELAHLQKVQKDLENIRKQYEAQAVELAKIAALWKQIQAVGLEPDRWISHPLAVSKTLSWDEYSRLVLLSANTIDTSGGYWFKPEKLRVVRVVGESQESNQGKDRPITVGGEGGEAKQVELYDATFEGKFLIRKE